MPRDTDPAARSGWRFDNSYSRLPACLYERLAPEPVRAPLMAVFNRPLAEALGLDADALADAAGAAVFAGNRLPEGADPIAQAYAGHQFGHFTILGDGRAHLLGEQLTPYGARFDIQLKGSGPTPFSRNGDGRAALGPMLREYIISEAIAALGIPTTRSLAVVTTGQQVFRETPLPGAILTRVAASHIRVGTFQYLAAQHRPQELRTLAEYTIRRHYAELEGADNPFAALLLRVVERQAALVADWMHVGFVHGVMNTDNTALSGETIDYGPCAFIDRYDPATVFSSIDREGRYAFGQQPAMAQWNLARFAETLLPLLHEEESAAVDCAGEIVSAFPAIFSRFWLAGMRTKVGLFNEEAEDAELLGELLGCLQRQGADYTNTLRALADASLPETPLFAREEFRHWHTRWQARLARQPQTPEEVRALMRARNPAVIPRNHRVEAALAAAQQGDFSVMRQLLAVLARPYEAPPEHAAYREPPPPSDVPYKTFCGT